MGNSLDAITGKTKMNDKFKALTNELSDKLIKESYLFLLDRLGNKEENIGDIIDFLWRILDMPLILGKSKALVPKGVKIIKHIGHPEKKAISVATQIAKDFGQIAKKMNPKKIIIR